MLNNDFCDILGYYNKYISPDDFNPNFDESSLIKRFENNNSMISFANNYISISSTENSKKKSIRFISKKQRGKPGSNNNDKHHLGSDEDNIRKKIQIHYQNFIPSFFNDIISIPPIKKNSEKFKKFFLKFEHSQKIDIKNEYMEGLKKSTIEEIIKKSKISKKYKACNNSNYNEQKLVLLDKNESIKKLLKMNYLDFFLIYYNNSEPLKQFKIDGKIIQLSKETKSFYYLIQKYPNDAKELLEMIKMDYLDKIESTNESEYNIAPKELNLEDNFLEI